MSFRYKEFTNKILEETKMKLPIVAKTNKSKLDWFIAIMTALFIIMAIITAVVDVKIMSERYPNLLSK